MGKNILEYNSMRKKVSEKKMFELEVEVKLGRMMTAGAKAEKNTKNVTMLLMRNSMNTV